MKKFMRVMTAAAIVAALSGSALQVVAGERDTPERSGDVIGLTAGGTVYAGEMVCVFSNSLAYVAGDTTNYVVVGRAENTVDADGVVMVKRGVFCWANQGSFADKDIGSICYVWTNTAFSVTTAAIASADIKAGRIVDVDSGGVWVDSTDTER